MSSSLLEKHTQQLVGLGYDIVGLYYSGKDLEWQNVIFQNGKYVVPLRNSFANVLTARNCNASDSPYLVVKTKWEKTEQGEEMCMKIVLVLGSEFPENVDIFILTISKKTRHSDKT